MAFRKDIPFKVSKEESKSLAGTELAPAAEPSAGPVEVLDAGELQKLRGQWREALQEAWATRLNPDVKMFTVNGARRLFYCVSGGTLSASSQEFLALDEELLPVRLNVGCNLTPMGPIINVQVEPLKPAPERLSPDKAAVIAKRLIEEFPKGGETEK